VYSACSVCDTFRHATYHCYSTFAITRNLVAACTAAAGGVSLQTLAKRAAQGLRAEMLRTMGSSRSVVTLYTLYVLFCSATLSIADITVLALTD
jgi:hypothetical protein